MWDLDKNWRNGTIFSEKLTFKKKVHLIFLHLKPCLSTRSGPRILAGTVFDMEAKKSVQKNPRVEKKFKPLNLATKIIEKNALFKIFLPSVRVWIFFNAWNFLDAFWGFPTCWRDSLIFFRFLGFFYIFLRRNIINFNVFFISI